MALSGLWLPRTAWIELSSWQRPRFERTAPGIVVRLGWVSIGFARLPLTRWVAEWRGTIKKALP